MSASERAWSSAEARALVAEYFDLWRIDLDGGRMNKRESFRRLALRFPARSAKSFEWKAQNVSAVLLESGRPFLRGLAPAFNYQSTLVDTVLRFLAAHPGWDERFRRDAESFARAAAPPIPDPERIARELEKYVEAPPRGRDAGPRVEAAPVAEGTPLAKADFFAIEARNRALGAAGEEFALNWEVARLLHAGREDLAQRVEHVSRTRGDGLGYDIESVEPDGRPRFVEVKTTTYPKETPFYVTRHELDVSGALAPSYHLHRVFDFPRSSTLPRGGRRPRLFTLAGPMEAHCRLDPTEYRATPR